MARIDNIINVNSVWNITEQQTILDSVKLKVWIYTGTQGAAALVNIPLGADNSRPESASYELVGSSILVGTDRVVQFDIAPLVRDYIESELNQSHNSDNAVWVDIQATNVVIGEEIVLASEHFLALDGYEYTMDIVGNQIDDILRISSDLILNSEGEDVSIPFLRKDVASYVFSKDGTNVQSVQTVTSTSDLSNEQVVYIESPTGTQVDKLIVTTVGGETIPVVIQNECYTKYEHVKLTFVNRFGAFEDVWFFANSRRSLSVKTDEWNRRNKVIGGGHWRGTTVKNTRSVNEKHTINSGNYPESSNVVFEELLQSNNVWIHKGIETFPIMIKTVSFRFKDSNTDKAINYEIEWQYAFNKMKSL
jgi:hypothetical protein